MRLSTGSRVQLPSKKQAIDQPRKNSVHMAKPLSGEAVLIQPYPVVPKKFSTVKSLRGLQERPNRTQIYNIGGHCDV